MQTVKPKHNAAEHGGSREEMQSSSYIGRLSTPVIHCIDLGDIAKLDEWLKLFVVCSIHDVTNPKILKDFFRGMGFLGCKVAILDRRRVIISFETTEDVEKFLAEEYK